VVAFVRFLVDLAKLATANVCIVRARSQLHILWMYVLPPCLGWWAGAVTSAGDIVGCLLRSCVFVVQFELLNVVSAEEIKEQNIAEIEDPRAYNVVVQQIRRGYNWRWNCFVASVLSLVVAWGASDWGLMWVAAAVVAGWTYHQYCCGGSQQWYHKTAYASIGGQFVFVCFAADIVPDNFSKFTEDKVVGGLLANSLWSLLYFNIQDWKDTARDRDEGRVTLVHHSLEYLQSETRARVFWAGVVIVSGLAPVLYRGVLSGALECNSITSWGAIVAFFAVAYCLLVACDEEAYGLVNVAFTLATFAATIQRECTGE